MSKRLCKDTQGDAYLCPLSYPQTLCSSSHHLYIYAATSHCCECVIQGSDAFLLFNATDWKLACIFQEFVLLKSSPDFIAAAQLSPSTEKESREFMFRVMQTLGQVTTEDKGGEWWCLQKNDQINCKIQDNNWIYYVWWFYHTVSMATLPLYSFIWTANWFITIHHLISFSLPSIISLSDTP